MGVPIGTLSCNVAAGWGFVFGSSKALHCTLTPGWRHPEHYAGAISKFGIDIGYTNGGVLVWAVFAPGPYVAGRAGRRLCRRYRQRYNRGRGRCQCTGRRLKSVDFASAAQH